MLLETKEAAGNQPNYPGYVPFSPLPTLRIVGLMGPVPAGNSLAASKASHEPWVGILYYFLQQEI